MTTTETFIEAFRALPREDRGRVYDAIQQEIWVEEPDQIDAIKRELDRRIADCDANPDDESPLGEVMAEADEIIRQCRSR
jgi:putative addiction module component (TIGR02574 family)